ncbi:MAG: hypothetical protein ABMA64_00830 [Myxococcota bacterium]
MFNPMGMAVGLLVARQRGSTDAITPALLGGALPMPLGPLAALLLAQPAPAPPVVVATPVPVEPPKVEDHVKRLGDAITGVTSAKGPKLPPAVARLWTVYGEALAARAALGADDKGLGELLRKALDLLLTPAPTQAS